MTYSERFRQIPLIYRVTVLLLVISLLLPCVAQGAEKKYMQVKVSNNSVLYLRADPDPRSAVLGKYKNGAVVTVSSVTGSWAKVTAADGAKGYMSADFLIPCSKEQKQTSSFTKVSKTMVTTAGKLSLRSAPDTSSEKLAVLDAGVAVQAVAFNGTWYQVKVNGQLGYIRHDYLKEGSSSEPAKKPTGGSSRAMLVWSSNGSRVNLRQQPSASSKKLDSLPFGTPVTVLEPGTSWTRVSVNGQPGYIASEYLREEKQISGKEKTAVVDNSFANNVNLRSAKDQTDDSNILTRLMNGTRVTVLQKSGDWTKVYWNGLTGFMRTYMLNFSK